MVAYRNVCLCECQNKELEWDLKQDNAECKLNFNKFIILACTWHYGPYFTGTQSSKCVQKSMLVHVRIKSIQFNYTKSVKI